ncbi:MAG: Flp pilus assembly protein CpaB, partial [Thermomicrobiales bacterium]
MRGSSRKTMLVAFLLAALAAAAVYFLLAGRGGGPKDGKLPAAPVETVPVVVAARDIPADTLLTEADVEVDQIPAKGRHPRALTDPAQAVGNVTNADLLLGEPILDSRLVMPEDAEPNTFARDVPPGFRAVALSADEIKLVGGLVQPGDRVDVVGYFQFQSNSDKQSASGGAGTPEPTKVGSEPVINAEPTPTAAAGASNPAATLYVLQDVEVMSVAQALTPSDRGVDASGAAPADAAASAAKDLAAVGSANDPVARPDASSITLLVPANEVARLLLAVNSVPSDGALRLVLRSPGDTGVTLQQAAVTSGDASQYELGDIQGEISTSPLLVLSAEFAKRVLLAGEKLEFTVTVKNVSSETIEPGVGGAPDGYTYKTATAWDTEGFFEKPDSLRIGLNFAGAKQPFPWRWTLPVALEPGQEATLAGAVELEQPTTGKRFWFGIMQEPGQVLEDGIGVTDIRVEALSAVRVTQAGAELREEPTANAKVVGAIEKGIELTVIGQEPGWYQVESS